MTRIGVTGHRRFDHPERARQAAQRVVAGCDPPLELWTSLADGADRLLVDVVRAVDPAARLVVVLPLAPHDYRADFDADSAAEFDELLATADEVHTVAPQRTREAAYAAAGMAVVDAVDVLVAVWDGAPARGHGGTAEIVQAARTRGREVAVIPVTRAAT